jgi:hypothetical protein
MVSRAEAIERAEQDHGDDDDVVWMKQNKKGRGRIYHDNPQCSYLSSNATSELTRGQAQNRGYGACKVCTLKTADKSSTGNRPVDLIEALQQKMGEID